MSHRTPQACIPCRDRKIKCNGARPCCWNCIRRHKSCRWPENGVANAAYVRSRDLTSADDPPGIQDVISDSQARLLLDIFFSEPNLELLHLSIHRPNFDVDVQAPALLLSIYCAAALFLSEDHLREVFNGEPAIQVSDRLLGITRSYLRSSSEAINVPAIQTHLVVCYRNLLCREGIEAWMSAGLAIRKAQALRLGREYHQRHSPQEREIRRRVMWTCFIIDHLVSFATSRPRTIQARTLSIRLPCPKPAFLFGEDRLVPTLASLSVDQFESTDMMSYFLKALHLWAEVNDQLQEWVIGQSNLDISDNVRLDHDLMAWLSSLPPKLQWSRTNYATFRLLGGANLFALMHLLLHHALCLTWRRSLPHGDDISGLLDQSSRPLIMVDGIAQCRAEAILITDIAATILEDKRHGDRSILSSPFAGLALTGSASIFIWLANAMPMLRRSQANDGHLISAEVTEANAKLDFIKVIMRSCSGLLRLVSTWLETISFLEEFYGVAYNGTYVNYKDAEFGEERPLDTTSSSSDIVSGSGLPDLNSDVISWPLSRQALILSSGTLEPSASRVQFGRSHIRALWERVWSQVSAATPQAWFDINDSFQDRPDSETVF